MVSTLFVPTFYVTIVCMLFTTYYAINTLKDKKKKKNKKAYFNFSQTDFSSQEDNWTTPSPRLLPQENPCTKHSFFLASSVFTTINKKERIVEKTAG